VNPKHRKDDVLDDDIILIRSDDKGIVTGSDTLGSPLRGIVQNPEVDDSTT